MSEPTAKDALQAIANLPTGANEDVMRGQEEAYRAVEALFSEAPMIEANREPSAHLEPLGYISAYGLGKIQTRRHYCVSVSHQAEKEFIIPIFREAPAASPDSRGEDEAVEAMVLSLRNPFPSESLSRAGGIDRWREIMRDAYRAALTTESQP